MKKREILINLFTILFISNLYSPHSIYAQSAIQEFWFGKTAFHQQIGDKDPILDPVHPYAFSSKCIINGRLLSANITLNATQYNYTKTGNNQAEIFTLFKKYQDLTDCFPDGNYTLNVNSSNASYSTVLRNEIPQFPTPPRILSGNNTCWINQVLCITNNQTDATFSWTNANEQIDGVWVSDENGGNTLPPDQNSYTLTKNYIDSLPFDTPIYHLVQLQSYLGNAATTFYLYKPSPISNDDYILLSKTRSFLQVSNNSSLDWGTKKDTVFFEEYGPFSFSVESSQPKTILSPKSEEIRTADSWIGNYRFNSGPIASKSALDQAYPDGNYTTGNQSIKLLGSNYPNNSNPIKILKVNGKTPNWENGKLIIDSKIRNTIEWSQLLTNQKTKFEINFDINYINGFHENVVNIESGSFKENKRAFSSFVIPANTAKTTNEYFLSIKYYNYCTDTRARYGICTYVWVLPK